MKNTAGETVSGSESAVAYEELKGEIEAKAAGECAPLNTDPSHASQVMLTAWASSKRYEGELRKLGCERALTLEKRALALAHVNALYRWSTEEQVPLEALGEEVQTRRKVLLSELDLLQARGLMDKRTVTVQSTVSYLGMAEDVRTIGTAILAKWSTVGAEIGGNEQRIQDALVAADKLLRAVAENEALKEKAKGAAQLRAGAWTLALEAYRELERGMDFIRFYEDDAGQFVPVLFGPSKGRRRSAATESGDAEAATNSNGAASNAGASGNGASSNGAATNSGANAPSAPMAPSKSFEE